MNSDKAARLVDKWAAELRTYLDGKLHRVARQALIDRIVAATAEDASDDASEDLEGRATDADVKAVALKVHAADVAKREAAAARVVVAKREELPGEPSSDVDRLAGLLAGGKDEAEHLVATVEDEATKAREALAVMQDVATSTGQPLRLTPRQIDRFNEFGLLDGLKYQTAEPAPVDAGVPVENKPKRGRPANR